MKKLSQKQRIRDIKVGCKHRKKKVCKDEKRAVIRNNTKWLLVRDWIDERINEGLNISIGKKNIVTIFLPEKMDFHENYDSTVLYITAIRKFTDTLGFSERAYRLGSVKLDGLKTISTSAALVLTAELSKWDDVVRKNLVPLTESWSKDILCKFYDLGFFDLFSRSEIDSRIKERSEKSCVNLVKYIKGKCGDSDKTRLLKSRITEVVGDDVKKWTFLHGGLTEAITNVSHHAYPEDYGALEEDKNWYLTGAYNAGTKELKIVFYDQGIGIPKSLPTSHIWEKVLAFLSSLPITEEIAERKKDEKLLSAAVQLSRTSTKELDRGKGLQDLLEFIRQRGDGYISIMSLKGLYKYSLHNGKESIKTESFNDPICGTLIIWSVTL